MSRGAGIADWDAYLDRFHGQRPGITERILAASVDRAGRTAYDWAAEAVPQAGTVIDLACGSAPLWSDGLAGRYLGVDASAAELALAAARGAHELRRATASAIPAPDEGAAAVVCSMALMVLPDPGRVLAEVARVLQPGGVLVATMPTAPRAVGQLVLSAGLVRAAGGFLGYRNDALLHRPDALFRRHGLTLDEDATRAYRYDLAAPGAPEAMAASLYLAPPVAEHEAAVAGFLRGVARRRRPFLVPIRRLVARRTGDPR